MFLFNFTGKQDILQELIILEIFLLNKLTVIMPLFSKSDILLFKTRMVFPLRIYFRDLIERGEE